MNKIVLAIFGTVGLLPALSAAAEETGRFYAGIYAGAGQTHDAKLEIAGFPPGTLLFEPGYRLGGVAGYDFAGSLRAELDLAWRMSPVDHMEAPSVGDITATGTVTALSGVTNLIYEPAVTGRLQPHLGIGFGVVRLAIADAVADMPILGPTPVADDSVIVPAWQFLGGVSWPLSERLDLTAEYRLFGALSPEFVGVSSARVETEYTDSTFSFGLRAWF